MPILPVIKSHVTRLLSNSASSLNGILREQSGTVEPPPASVTGQAEPPKAVAKSLELGAHRYLVKYPSLQTITTIVRSVYPLTVF
jgi:hypothetical protein